MKQVQTNGVPAAAAGSAAAPSNGARADSYDPDRIRNFCIIAHIDHGKSTLADRLLEATGDAVGAGNARTSVWTAWSWSGSGALPLSCRPFGSITAPKTASDYMLNLIDTPGHVDFSYEVSRSLLACEGALLVIDASQGVEAQTLANLYLALEADLEIIPVINKIDLPSADPDRVLAEIGGNRPRPGGSHFGQRQDGAGVDDILEAIVNRIPPPPDDPDATLQGPRLRLPLRSVPGRRRLRAGDGGVRPVGMPIRFMASGQSTWWTSWRSCARNGARGHAAGRGSRLRAGRHQERERRPGGRYDHRRPRARRRSRCPATGRPDLWCSAAFILWTMKTSVTCGMRWKSCS